MSISVKIDEKRVIILHNAGLSAHVISRRFDCGVSKIRNILIRHGLDPKIVDGFSVNVPGCGAIRRYGHRPGLGD